MGGSISVCNKSNVPIHVSLDQVGPLYYKNFLAPGETWTQSTGRVWFTINSRLASPGKPFSTSDVVLPTATCGVLRLEVVPPAVAASGAFKSLASKAGVYACGETYDIVGQTPQREVRRKGKRELVTDLDKPIKFAVRKR